jgi:hypothetical protein
MRAMAAVFVSGVALAAMSAQAAPLVPRPLGPAIYLANEEWVPLPNEPGRSTSVDRRGLGIRNSRQALSRLPERQKGVITADTLGGPQQISEVSESGFYRLAITSRLKEGSSWSPRVAGGAGTGTIGATGGDIGTGGIAFPIGGDPVTTS